MRQIDITRALRAAAASGLQVSRFEIHPDGKLVVWVSGDKEPERDYLAEWRADRARRAAILPATPPALPQAKKRAVYAVAAFAKAVGLGWAVLVRQAMRRQVENKSPVRR